MHEIPVLHNPEGMTQLQDELNHGGKSANMYTPLENDRFVSIPERSTPNQVIMVAGPTQEDTSSDSFNETGVFIVRLLTGSVRRTPLLSIGDQIVVCISEFFTFFFFFPFFIFLSLQYQLFQVLTWFNDKHVYAIFTYA